MKRLQLGQQLLLLSWNLLAPPYKRMGGGLRESQLLDWRTRVQTQIEYVRDVDADIVGLQVSALALSLPQAHQLSAAMLLVSMASGVLD